MTEEIEIRPHVARALVSLNCVEFHRERIRNTYLLEGEVMIEWKRIELGLGLGLVLCVGSAERLLADEPIKVVGAASFRGSVRLAQGQKESTNEEAKEEAEAVSIDAITLKIPATWEKEKPSNNLRLAQYKLPAAEGDKTVTEFVISSFPGGGGGVDQNLKRWIDQFTNDGRRVKMATGDCEQGKYHISDIRGTYLQSTGGPFSGGKKTPMPSYRSLSAVLSVPEKGVYFLRMTGPEKSVTAAEEAFRTAFGADAKKDKDYEIQ